MLIQHEVAPAAIRRRRLRSHGATWEPALRRWRVQASLLGELNLHNRLDTPTLPR